MRYSIYAVIIAFIIGVILCPVLIPILHKLKYGQTERDDGPQSHLKKSGTPTMGGIAILGAIILSSAFFMKGNYDGAAVLVVTVCFGVIGFIDDYIKVVKKRSLGLRAYQKIVLQLIVFVFFALYIHKTGVGTKIYIPFMNGYMLDLKIIYWPFMLFVLLGTVNGVNLTDGLDGLAGGVTRIVAAFFLIEAWAVRNGISMVSGAVIGALFAFLTFNAYPAKVFMGDTGSLALGGFVAASAIILKLPVFIVIVGFIYLCESLSVIIQVAVFKKTGKRVFKMAPIHHHFELCGWSETKIVFVFYIITALMCLIGILGSGFMFA